MTVNFSGDETRLAFIGAGHMGVALIDGLVASGYAPERIAVFDIDSSALERLHNRTSVRVFDTASAAVEGADLLLLAVPPKNLPDVCAKLASAVQQQAPLVVSIAAGVRIELLLEWLGGGVRVVRAMPNLPASIRRGISGLYAPASISTAERAVVERVMSAAGAAVWVDSESALNWVTAISGSGPAYFFLMIEVMQQAAESLGLSRDLARELALETACGASELARQSALDADCLRRNICIEGGTTQAAIGVLEQSGFRQILTDAIEAAATRATALAER